MQTKSNVPFSEIGSIRAGGEIAEIVEVTNENELVDASLKVWSSANNWMILGDGTNTLVSDSGFDGTMIRTIDSSSHQLSEIVTLLQNQEGNEEAITIRAWAGINWDDLVAATVAAGFADLAPLSGIPGTVGAAPIQNIAAYGGGIASTINSVRFLDFETSEVIELQPADLEFGYRSSALQRRPGAVISVDFLLSNRSITSNFTQILERLQQPDSTKINPSKLRETVLALRSEKGMVLSETDPDSVSLGSFFKNPIVSHGFATGITNGPKWVEEEGVKLSAAWLIDNAGIHKGFALPGSDAAISSKHTLAITNRGKATSEQILELANYIQLRVASEWGVNLEPEPGFVGFYD